VTRSSSAGARRSTTFSRRRSELEFRFCDDAGADGFGWIVDEAMTRTSHTLAADGKVWLVDALDWPQAIERARELGRPAGVIQLLDRHHRDCAALAEQLGVPHVVVPDELHGSPFTFIPIMRWKRWRECALWWPQTQTLVVADAMGTNRFYTAGKALLGVHLFLRLTPPKALSAVEPARIFVGHGEGLLGPGAAEVLGQGLVDSRRRLPGVLLRLPFALARRHEPRPHQT
jgi:hypothetical protein